MSVKNLLKTKLTISTFLPKLDKIHSMEVLFQELELASPLIGFLEQNQVCFDFFFFLCFLFIYFVFLGS